MLIRDNWLVLMLFRNATDKTEVEWDIGYVLRDMKTNLDTGFLEVFVRNSTNIFSVPSITVSTMGTTVDCPIGSYKEDAVGCG